MSKRKLETLKIKSLPTALDAESQRQIIGGSYSSRSRKNLANLIVTRGLDVRPVRMAPRPLSSGGFITTLPTRL